MMKKNIFLLLFIFFSQPSLRTFPPQDDYTVVSDDSEHSESEYYDELDSKADRQPDVIEEQTGITIFAKNFIYTHMPVWAKRFICSLIIALDQASEYASAKWDVLKKSLPL